MRLAAVSLIVLLGAAVGTAGIAYGAAPATQRIPGTRLLALAKGALGSVHVTRNEALILAAPVTDQILGPGSVALRVESPLVTPSYVNVPIDILLDGSFVRTDFVGYRVQKYVRTAVATHDLIAGSVLGSRDVALARVPSFGRPPNGTRALIGRKIVTTVRKGQPIYPEETATNLIVTAGSTVLLIVNDGGVSVVTEVQARSSGGLGDEVALYNPRTNTSLSGQVVGPDRVELDLLGVHR